jgi:hypothetical protein
MPLSCNETRHNAIRFAKEARHYNSESDILKVIRSLFLDDLRAEFNRLVAKMNSLAFPFGQIAAN